MRAFPRSILGLGFASFLLLATTGSAATCYVDATHVDDSRTPVQAQNMATPWRTIRKAASTMAAGDTAVIRAGTYRETVTPQSGQTFAAYENEKPPITGEDVRHLELPADWKPASRGRTANSTYHQADDLPLTITASRPVTA